MKNTAKRGGLTPAQTRLGWAVLISSLFGPVTCAFAPTLRPGGGFTSDFFIGLAFCTVFGWPVGMALAAIGAYALGKKIQQRNAASIVAAVFLGIVVGALVTPVVNGFVVSRLNGVGDPGMPFVGAVAGFFISSCFCLIAPVRTESAAGTPPADI